MTIVHYDNYVEAIEDLEARFHLDHYQAVDAVIGHAFRTDRAGIEIDHDRVLQEVA